MSGGILSRGMFWIRRLTLSFVWSRLIAPVELSTRYTTADIVLWQTVPVRRWYNKRTCTKNVSSSVSLCYVSGVSIAVPTAADKLSERRSQVADAPCIQRWVPANPPSRSTELQIVCYFVKIRQRRALGSRPSWNVTRRYRRRSDDTGRDSRDRRRAWYWWYRAVTRIRRTEPRWRRCPWPHEPQRSRSQQAAWRYLRPSTRRAPCLDWQTPTSASAARASCEPAPSCIQRHTLTAVK